ncbi:MAG: DUF1501 domain-containing protein, partial [Planctomycetales bacterium]
MTQLPNISRRRMLKNSALGFGGLAASCLLTEEAQAERRATRSSGPLAPRIPDVMPRAKRVVFLFMKGGPSSIDTFDYKPRLQKDHGKPLPFDKPRIQFAPTKNLLRSPWTFSRHGRSGVAVSELFPHVAQCVDEICFLHAVHGTNAAHGGACLKLHTGSDAFVRPSMGAWATYGLGSENRNLPG